MTREKEKSTISLWILRMQSNMEVQSFISNVHKKKEIKLFENSSPNGRQNANSLSVSQFTFPNKILSCKQSNI